MCFYINTITSLLTNGFFCFKLSILLIIERMIRLNQEYIASFLSVVQHQTITAAAESLFVSQSTISHRIQLLEQELNITLFDRQRGFKKMELTEDGKKFHPLALQWMEINSMMHNIHSTNYIGTLRIGSMDSINQYLLPPIFSKIRDNLPSLNLEFVSYHSQELYSRINTQQIHLAFAFYPIHYNIVATPVFSEPMYMISPPGSIYPHGSIHPSQLKKSDEVFFTWDENIIHWNNEWWDEHEPPYVKVDSCGLLTTFLTAPERWALCPASVASSLRTSFNVEIHELEKTPPNRTTYLLRRKGVSPSVQRSMDAFLAEFNQIICKHPWAYKNK